MVEGVAGAQCDLEGTGQGQPGPQGASSDERQHLQGRATVSAVLILNFGGCWSSRRLGTCVAWVGTWGLLFPRVFSTGGGAGGQHSSPIADGRNKAEQTQIEQV